MTHCSQTVIASDKVTVHILDHRHPQNTPL